MTQATCTLVFQMEGEAGKEQQQKKDLFGIKTCAKIASEKKNETTCKQTFRRDHQSSGTPASYSVVFFFKVRQ